MHTRRALLAATPALAALPATPAKANPDAALLALVKRHAEASARSEAAELAVIAAEDAAKADTPPRPEAFKVRADDWFPVVDALKPGRFHTPETVDRWERALRLGHYRQLMSRETAERFRARTRELVAARRASAKAAKAAAVANGVAAARALADRRARSLYAIETRLLDAPARTLEGVKAKARVVAGVIGPEDGTYEDRATRALLADLVGKSAVFRGALAAS